MGHGACIGLMVIVATSCTSSPGLPAAARPASAVQQPAPAGQQATPASQKPAETNASNSKDDSRDASDEKPRSIDLCALATADEMSAIIGKLKSDPKPLKGPAGEMMMCTFTTEAGQEVTFSYENALSWGVIKGASKLNQDRRGGRRPRPGGALRSGQRPEHLHRLDPDRDPGAAHRGQGCAGQGPGAQRR
jgi:hypothetical protein